MPLETPDRPNLKHNPFGAVGLKRYVFSFYAGIKRPDISSESSVSLKYFALI